ncbi:hypothetical protein [Synechocystis sp. LKSZ1]|uniref:eIF2A-related protein n=1 Tax=Synechocystis sp. LKSZ1 TaxID=3144951 RepID=UPI00336BE69F
MTPLLTFLLRWPQPQQEWATLQTRLQESPALDHAYFVRTPRPRAILTEFQGMLTQEAQMLDLSQGTETDGGLALTLEAPPRVLLLVGLEDCAQPQEALARIAQAKEKTYPEQAFHWVIGLTPGIEAEFRGLLSFLGGTSSWVDSCLGGESLDQALAAAIADYWRPHCHWDDELADRIYQLQGTMVPLAELTPAQQAHFSLLQGLYYEKIQQWGGLDPSLPSAVYYYHQSLVCFQQLEDRAEVTWVSLRLAYVYLLQAWSEKDRGHFLWQATQEAVSIAMAALQERDWRDCRNDTLILLATILRGLESWQYLQQCAEHFLVFFYQLSPLITGAEPKHGDCPWSRSQLALQTAMAYGLLTEALIEQWRFTEAKESLQRAWESLPPEPSITPVWQSWLHYLAGRCLLGEEQLEAAQESLELAKQLACLEDNPHFFSGILIELRECYYQAQQWQQVLAIDQEYQALEYQIGKRAFIGSYPLGPEPLARMKRHPLGVPLADSQPELPPPLPLFPALSLADWLATDTPLLLLSGEVGMGKSSWLTCHLFPELQEHYSHQCPLLLPIDPEWESKLLEHFQVETLNQSLASLESTVLLLDGDPEACPPSLVSFLCRGLAQKSLKILIALPPLALTTVIDRLGTGIPLPAFQHLRFPPIPKSYFQAYLQQVKADLGWDADLQAQVLEDLSDSHQCIVPLDWQRLGSELEERQITSLEAYQALGRDKLYWYRIERLLTPLPMALQTLAKEILQRLAESSPLPSLRTATELLAPESSQGHLMLQCLEQLRLVVAVPLGDTTYYRLSTPLLTQVLAQLPSPEPPESLTSPATPEPDWPLYFPEGSEAIDGIQRLRRQLTHTEQAYQKLLVGLRLERQSQIILRQAEFQPIEALLAALSLGQELRSLLPAEPGVSHYPSLGPLLALQQILGQIHERNRLEHPVAVSSLCLHPEGHTLATGSTEGVVRIWATTGELYHVLRGHQGDITSLHWSPQGDYLLSGSSDHTARLWNRQGQLQTTLQGHQKAVRSVRFSPVAALLLTSSRDGTVRLWNFAGEEQAQCQGHQHWVRNAEFSADGQQILSASRDGTARLWDLQGQELQVFRGHQNWVRNAQFSPDGQRILTASTDTTARIWDLSGHCLAILKGHYNWVRNAQWSPDGELVLTASSDGTARLWNQEGKTVAILSAQQQAVYDASFSPDGQSIVTLANDGTVRLWQRSGQLLAVMRGHQKEVYEAQFSQDSRRLFTISADHSARVWDLSEKSATVLKGHSNWVRNAHFNSQGDRILTVSRDHTARLWSDQGRCLATLESHHDWIREGQFSPDGHFIATASADKNTQLWNSAGKRLATLRGHQDAVLSVRFSPDSQFVLTASKDGTARLWNTTGQCLTVLRQQGQALFSAEFSPDGQFITTASADKSATLWDIVGKELAVCRGHRGAVHTIQFDPQGHYLLTASADHTARLWDLAGQEIAVLTGHQNIVYQAQFSPDGQNIVTASADRTARIWNRQGQELVALYGHQAFVNTAQFSPDGQIIVTASTDGTARLWDLLGRELAIFRGHSGWVRSAEFSPDGRWVVTASTDGTARLWPVDNLDQLLDRGCQWLEDYLNHNPSVPEKDKQLCVVKLTINMEIPKTLQENPSLSTGA